MQVRTFLLFEKTMISHPPKITENNFLNISDKKGNIIRLLIEHENKSKDIINPLKEKIAGISFSSDFLNKIFEIPNPIDVNNDELTLINSEGKKIRNMDIKSKITKIIAFVLYPDGTTWEGNISNKIDDIGLLIWEDNITSLIKNKKIVKNFLFENIWEDRPTTLIIRYNKESRGYQTQTACGGHRGYYK